MSIDRIGNSDTVALSLDFRDNKNRLALRINKDGVVNRTSNLILLHPNKSTFLIEDDFGAEFLRVRYVNPQVLEVTGEAVYCGRPIDIQLRNMHDSCLGNGGGTVYADQYPPACPTQQP